MKTIKRLTLIYIILLATFTVLITAVFCIPTSLVRGNVEKSAMQIEKDGLWYKSLGIYLFQIDNMTDCQMLRMNASADSSRPVWAAMMAEQYENVSDSLHPYYEVVENTKYIAHTGRTSPDQYSNYARYWHGYQIFLRPLLTVFSYHAIIVINYILLSLLILFVVYASYRAMNGLFAITLGASLIATNIFIVPLALQFSTCYYIALLGMALLMMRQEYASDKTKCLSLFFIIGGITSYMDFLTTPILTLGMPLVVMMAIRKRMKRDGKGFLSDFNTILSNSVAWGAGYSLLWISKWIIGSLLTGYNIFDSAMTNAKLRIGDTIVFGGKEMALSDFMRMVFDRACAVVSVYGIILFILAVVAVIAIYIYCHRRQTRLYGWFLVIAIMPIVWFAVMKNHSLQHIFFTWRDFLLTVWCAALYICLTLRKPRAI